MKSFPISSNIVEVSPETETRDWQQRNLIKEQYFSKKGLQRKTKRMRLRAFEIFSKKSYLICLKYFFSQISEILDKM